LIKYISLIEEDLQMKNRKIISLFLVIAVIAGFTAVPAVAADRELGSIRLLGNTSIGWDGFLGNSAATHLILELNAGGILGFGTLQLVIQGASTGWEMEQTVIADGFGEPYDYFGTTYLVIDITGANGYSTFLASTEANDNWCNIGFWSNELVNLNTVINAWLTSDTPGNADAFTVSSSAYLSKGGDEIISPGSPPPRSPSNLQFNIANDVTSPTVIGQVRATGDDITYSVETLATPHTGTVSVDAQTGEITYTPPFGTVKHDIFRITAENAYGSSSTKVVVTVSDPPEGKTIYVAPNGVGNGMSEDSPVLPQRAHDISSPGDTILFMDGTYTTTNSWALLNITRSGLPGYPITYKAMDGHKPILKTDDSWSVIFVESASYIIIDGLTITNADVDPELAQEAYDFKVANGGRSHPDERKTNTNGIAGGPHPSFRIHDGSVRQQMDRAVFPHHITVRNCEVFNMPDGGITFLQTDWLTVENNYVHNNCKWGLFAGSGINIYQAYDIDDNTTDYKFKFLNNISANNEHFIKWYLTGNYSDGNGIIIDDNRKTQNNHVSTAYRGKTLIANNLVYGNGGSGIHSFQSDNVDIINNTSYLNNVTHTRFSSAQMAWGEIFAQNSSNMNIFNNIAFVQPYEARNNMNIATSNIVYGGNIFFSGANPVTRTHPLGNDNGGPGDLVGGIEADPLFTDPAAHDFSLQPGSPGLTGADREWASLVGNTTEMRGVFGHIGAIESASRPPASNGQTSEPAEPSPPNSPDSTPADPDSPPEDKDGSLSWIWITAIILAAAGAAVCGIVIFLKKRK
jgi:hypothetical protein